MTQAELRGIIAEIMADGATCLNCANEVCYQNGRFCKDSPGIPCENHVPETCATCEYFVLHFGRTTGTDEPLQVGSCTTGFLAVPANRLNDACELYAPLDV